MPEKVGSREGRHSRSTCPGERGSVDGDAEPSHGCLKTLKAAFNVLVLEKEL